MAAKIGGGAKVNLPALLRILADAIDDTTSGAKVGHTKPIPTGSWRTLSFTYMVRDNDPTDPIGVRPQDVFIDYMSDLTAAFPEDVVESEGQARHGAGQETP